MISTMRTDRPCCSRTARMVRPILASSLWAIMPTLQLTDSSPCRACKSPGLDRSSFLLFVTMVDFPFPLSPKYIDVIEESINLCLHKDNLLMSHENNIWYTLFEMLFLFDFILFLLMTLEQHSKD